MSEAERAVSSRRNDLGFELISARGVEATDPQAHAEEREARTADLQAALDEHAAEVERIRTIGTQYATEVTEAWAALQ